MPTLPDDVLAGLLAPLAAIDTALARHLTGPAPGRQPVHTVYVPADRFGADTVPVWQAEAEAALSAYAADPATLAAVTGARPALADAVFGHVRRTLAGEPVQDLRIDFEDGYGIRTNAEEDDHVTAAVAAVHAARAAGTLPRRYGIRAKSLDPAVRERGLATLDAFLSGLAGPTEPTAPAGAAEPTKPTGGGRVPAGLVVTLPKVSAPEQVTVFVAVLAELERRIGLPVTPLELQIETPAAVLALPALVEAGGERLIGLHVGTFDYSAALGISAEHQASDHPAVELATSLMQLTAAGTRVAAVDGSCNLLPVGGREAVHAGWSRHAGQVRRAWMRGLYQGWDLHPAQLVSRHAAVAACLLDGLPAALERLAAYTAARQDGAVADEPATARALAGHVQRAVDAGLLSDTDARAAGAPGAAAPATGDRA